MVKILVGDLELCYTRNAGIEKLLSIPLYQIFILLEIAYF